MGGLLQELKALCSLDLGPGRAGGRRVGAEFGRRWRRLWHCYGFRVQEFRRLGGKSHLLWGGRRCRQQGSDRRVLMSPSLGRVGSRGVRRASREWEETMRVGVRGGWWR